MPISLSVLSLDVDQISSSSTHTWGHTWRKGKKVLIEFFFACFALTTASKRDVFITKESLSLIFNSSSSLYKIPLINRV